MVSVEVGKEGYSSISVGCLLTSKVSAEFTGIPASRRVVTASCMGSLIAVWSNESRCNRKKRREEGGEKRRIRRYDFFKGEVEKKNSSDYQLFGLVIHGAAVLF